MLVEPDGVLYSGDVVYTGRVPFICGADTRLWLTAIDRLLQIDDRVMVPGHGPASYDPRKDAQLTRDYIELLRPRRTAPRMPRTISIGSAGQAGTSTCTGTTRETRPYGSAARRSARCARRTEHGASFARAVDPHPGAARSRGGCNRDSITGSVGSAANGRRAFRYRHRTYAMGPVRSHVDDGEAAPTLRPWGQAPAQVSHACRSSSA
ncbi:MAG: hypothetical protein M9885_14355, partial [Burkholderiaceae bacterium]|nr:hypothetical protein [Burkholderiaceae bacterium]